jgi:hypothetical protein
MKRPASDVNASGAGLDETLDQLGSHPMSDDKTKEKPVKLTPVSNASPLGLTPHPLALVFPAYDKDKLDEPTNDIRGHGMRLPVVIFEDMVLDGRNRVEAAKQIAAEQTNFYIPRLMFEGTFDQARDYVVSMNMVRRHLDVGQRAMIAADLANLPKAVECQSAHRQDRQGGQGSGPSTRR